MHFWGPQELICIFGMHFWYAGIDMHFWDAFLVCISPNLEILHAFCLKPKMVEKYALCTVKCIFWVPGPAPRKCIFSKAIPQDFIKNRYFTVQNAYFGFQGQPPENAYFRNLAIFEGFQGGNSKNMDFTS